MPLTEMDTWRMKLTPTEDLMMEVLVARFRLGERMWTFDSNQTFIARRLEAKGMVGWKSGIVEKSILVWMTDEGKAIYINS